MKINWQYIAGFFDGEGCFSLTQDRHSIYSAQPRIHVSQSGEIGREILTEIATFLEAQGINSAVNGPMFKLKRQVIWQLSIYTRLGVSLTILNLLPYLRVKRVKALDIIRFLSIYPALSPGTMPHSLIHREAYEKRTKTAQGRFA